MAIVTTILAISAGLAIIVGILVLAFPKFLRWFVDVYLIVAGILQFI
ncbi:MAG: DUF3096 domain-containing protein [Nanoarchaeota archaeon]|nr:DUF3096 domain-containing protein [Nanoarchaeota archaeon]